MATIIVLNGTSSAGKSTIARRLQSRAPMVLLNFSIDSILSALPEQILDRMKTVGGVTEINPHALVSGYYGCIRELAAAGNSLISDNAITSREQAAWLLQSVEGHEAVIVGVTCSLATLEKRERERGDRRIGVARAQFDKVHRWLAYDLEIDTDCTSADDASETILSAFGSDRDGIERTRALLRREDV